MEHGGGSVNEQLSAGLAIFGGPEFKSHPGPGCSKHG